MQTLISEQLRALTLALMLGLACGLVYDLLRPLRYYCGTVSAFAADIIFSACAAGAAFLFAMGRGSGRPGTWELIMTLAGFMLYLHMFSDSMLKILASGRKMSYYTVCRGINIFKKFAVSTKKVFKKMVECFNIKN